MDGPRFRWTSSARSDVGLVRRINEDACLSLPERGLWAVADGMGGHAFGEIASAMVVDSLAALANARRPATMDDFSDDVRLALQVVNHALREQALIHDVALVGSTVVALLALGGECTVLWAGDSRAYRMHAGRLQQLTRDHSLSMSYGAVNGASRGAAYSVASGNANVAMAIDHRPGEEQARSDEDMTLYATPVSGGGASSRTSPVATGITRAVGAADALELDEIRFPIEDGDVLMLCSDGLSREVDVPDIARLLMPGNCRHAAQSLVALALQQGGRDNVSVVVIAADDLWSTDQTQLNPAC